MIYGAMDRLHLGDLLQWIQMSEESGRLSLRQRGVTRHLDFVAGRLSYVSSDAPHERVGSWFVCHDIVAAATLAPLVARSLLGTERLTDLVLRAELVPPDILCRELSRYAQHLLARALLSGAGRFTYDPEYPVRDLLGVDLDLDPNTVLLEAAKRSDEAVTEWSAPEVPEFPVSVEQYEEFFWTLVVSALGANSDVDCATLATIHDRVRDITATLNAWLGTFNGIVPQPRSQCESINAALGDGKSLSLTGKSQVTWNVTVVANSLPFDPPVMATLDSLAAFAEELDFSLDLATTERAQRPARTRLDAATATLSLELAAAAGAAAEWLGVEAGLAELAAHLVVVPTDLLLYVLTTHPIPSDTTRRALLKMLPPRLGAVLGYRGGLPSALQSVVAGESITPLGVALNVARDAVPNGALLPPFVPEHAPRLDSVVSPADLAQAAFAAREALGRPAASLG